MIVDYQNTWGVHPNSNLIAKNIQLWPDTIEVMSSDDIFNFESMDALSSIVEMRLKAVKQSRAPEFADERKLDPGLLSNVLLFPKGAVFVFSRYAVGCYAECEYYVTVPYSELTGVVNFANADLPAFILARKPIDK